jgi:uncharacterized protein
MIEEKSKRLDRILTDLGSFVLAFSGGVDSTFLLQRAHSLKKIEVIAATIRTAYTPVREISDAVEFTSRHGIKHTIIDIEFPEMIRNNPPQRCYLCKKNLFTDLIDFGKKNNLRYVADGTNADDTGEFRPGLKALNELGIRSPLLEAGLTKAEIRQLSKQADLSTWDRPAMACLLTRIPYNTVISESMLRMIEASENLFFELGFPGTRVRMHGDVARIECTPGYLERIMQKEIREQIITGMKKSGFRYISLDLEGYRTGSLNPQNHDS